MSSVPPSPSSAGGVGLSDSQLSRSRRKLLDLINRLHATGVQKDLDLPQIAVIGSQSAGKSSLIEAISGITLPRASGTCTRCPTECKLAHSNEPWKCIVTLRFSTGSDGRVLNQVRNEAFGPPITDKSEVEERIRRAQLAILNPNTPHHRFLDGDTVDHSELSFSSNCVSLQISGPDVADLSFCDLPGLIASASKGHESDIRLIENLVTSYIAKPSCIILLTVACETDFENQGAHRLVKEKDPEGKRTIGVLTKPDRIPTGEEPNWTRFIRNEREPLDNGWYSVRQPSSEELRNGITWDQAREAERVFFAGAPWSDLESTYQNHLGTLNLVTKLSLILSDLIAKRLPEILEELQAMIEETERKLAALPKPPSKDPFAELLVMLQGFVIDVAKHVEGVAVENALLQRIRPVQKTFKDAILDTAPRFRPFHEEFKDPLPPPDFLRSDDASGEDMQDDGDLSRMIYVDEVMHRAQNARTRELPGNYPFAVKQSYVTEFTAQWQKPSQRFHDAVSHIVSEYMKGIVVEHFSRFSHSGLDQRIKAIMADHVKACANNGQTKVDWLLRIETRAYTLNTHYLSNYRNKFFSYYKLARCCETNPQLMEAIEAYKNPPPVMRTAGPWGLEKVLAGLSEIGLHGVQPDDVAKILPPDEMEDALDIMADVRGYFQVAYKRITDNIPLALDHEIVLGLNEGLLSALLTGLKLNGPDAVSIATELMREDHAIASRREEYTTKLGRLMEANRELMDVTG